MSIVPEIPYDAVQRIELDAAPLAVVARTGLRVTDLPEVFDAAYPALGRAFADGALTPTSPAIAIYHGDPMGVFDLEIGFAVAEAPAAPITAYGPEITASALPSGAAFAATHVGGYEGLGAAWGGVVAAAAAQGAQPAGVWIEVYVSDPSDTAEDALRTDLVMPVAG